jgi:parallel beta-helix repeat protein
MRTLASSYNDVTVTAAKTMIDQKPYLVILDVRDQSEYDSGHIRNSKLIPVSELATRLNELSKTDEILVYCMAGGRSVTASQILADNGFSHVYNMLGGIAAWIAAGYPTYVKYSSIQEAINNANEGDTIHVSSGLYYEHLTVDKPLTLNGENKYTTIIDGSDNGTVINVEADNVTVTDFAIQESGCSCSDYAGVQVRIYHKNAILTNNRIVQNGYGIKLVWANNITIDRNEIAGNSYGIEILYSSNNTLKANNITANIGDGIRVESSSNNKIFHNKFAENERQAYVLNCNNSWDDGHPSGGNYWGDYAGVDLNQDGTGDSPHTLDENNADNYPLMGIFTSFTTSTGGNVNVVSNSTIEDFEYLGSNSTIRMHVSNMTKGQTSGFCQLTIPHDLLPPPYNVTVNNNLINYNTTYENNTLTIIYFSYQHSTLDITIIPEFPSFLVLPLLMIATLLALIRYRRKPAHGQAACKTGFSSPT